ncbi:MAG: alpha/beta fold hydrolase [Gammaproteobacteria bacterium]
MATTLMSGLFYRDSGGDGPLVLCLHGFGDHSGMYAPMLDTTLAGSARVVAPDFPGCGQSSPNRNMCSIDGQAQGLATLVKELASSGPVLLVGHSLASPVAVAMLPYLGHRVVGVFSIEGNLTTKDAYVSGQAEKWDDPVGFHAHMVKGSRNMANFKPELVRYTEALADADPQTLWELGRDAFNLSQNDAFGERYRNLNVPSVYYWSKSSTPLPTQAYLAEHHINRVEFVQGGHWPTVAEPAQTAQAIEALLELVA